METHTWPQSLLVSLPISLQLLRLSELLRTTANPHPYTHTHMHIQTEFPWQPGGGGVGVPAVTTPDLSYKLLPDLEAFLYIFKF